MKKWFKHNILYFAGALAGAVGGYLYWKFVGCASGTCAITSSPLNSTLYGAMMGSVFFGLFQRDKKQEHNSPGKNNDHDI